MALKCYSNNGCNRPQEVETDDSSCHNAVNLRASNRPKELQNGHSSKAYGSDVKEPGNILCLLHEGLVAIIKGP